MEQNEKINDLEKGLYAHEVMCEERWKTCFQRLEDVETSLNRIAVSYTHLTLPTILLV